jgi:hypothetical protein
MGISLRKAINDKCRECIYDQVAGWGTWREQVEACTADGSHGAKCPLYDARPVTTNTTKERVDPVKSAQATGRQRRAGFR